MKNSILLPLTIFLLTSNFLFSQDKFIELLVSDKTEIEAEEIYYEIIISPLFPRTYKSKKSELDLKTFESIIASIDGVEENENVLKSPRMSEHFPLIKHLKINDKGSLQQLQSTISKYPNVVGNITSLEHSQTESIFSELTDKVVIKAKKKADNLAKLMDDEMVEIVEVSEFGSTTFLNQDGEFDNSDKVVTSPEFESNNIRFKSTKLILTKKLRVKFRVK